MCEELEVKGMVHSPARYGYRRGSSLEWCGFSVGTGSSFKAALPRPPSWEAVDMDRSFPWQSRREEGGLQWLAPSRVQETFPMASLIKLDLFLKPYCRLMAPRSCSIVLTLKPIPGGQGKEEGA